MTQPEDDNLVQDKGAYFPLKYYTDFIDYLADNPSDFEIITYDDLMWQGERPNNGTYPEEFEAWNEALKSGQLNPNKIYVLIQHDLDTRPERAHAIMEYEASRGIPSNVMIFNKRVNRRKLAATGILEYTPYEIDFDLLRKLQEKKFVIGYHSNAYEQALYHVDRAQEIFQNDIEKLRQQVDIRYFSAHGGTPGPKGINNRDLVPLLSIEDGLTWVHNGVTPRFSSNYSDGGINSMHRDPSKRDLRDFVQQWRPGNRYRVLIHPQYYQLCCGRSPRMSGTKWYEEILLAYHSGIGQEVWADVRNETKQCKTIPQNRARSKGNGVSHWAYSMLKKIWRK